MRLGLQVPIFTWPGGQEQLGDTFALIAERAERSGFYSFWVMDHFFQIRGFGAPEQEMLEGWSALAFAAGRTNRIKLGTLVTGITYRHPGVLVKTATTLDALSHGRAYFGIGAAWNEEEHVGLGVPYPPLAERFERLEETLQIALQMWSGNEEAYHGKHYTLERPLNVPQAIHKPHPPIMIGGSGERKTLRMVAQYGDACNFFAQSGTDALQQKLDVLQEHCQKLNRPYAEIEKTVYNVFHITRDGRDNTHSPQQVIDNAASLAEMGFDQLIFSMPNVSDIEPFDVLAETIIPAVEKITPAGR